MLFINPNVIPLIQEPGLEGIFKQIAYSGHICYKSERVGGEKEFVESLIKRGHLSPLEHGTIYLEIPYDSEFNYTIGKYTDNKFSKVNENYITTNYRVIIENGWDDDLKYLVNPTDTHEKRYSFHITCSRGIMDEFVRHRVFSFSCESTRYCNYSKNKFGNELTFILPYWYGSATSEQKIMFVNSCKNDEQTYLKLINLTLKPQEAREVLPLSLKSEFVMTGFKSDWEHFFKLRCDSAAHPDAQSIANKIKTLLKDE